MDVELVSMLFTTVELPIVLLLIVVFCVDVLNIPQKFVALVVLLAAVVMDAIVLF